MKENIYTIPINQAFDSDSECPLCSFLKKEELGKINYTLGASMMEPDVRINSNENGYCKRHAKMMCDHGNRLSHALILETRLGYLSEVIDNFHASIQKNKKKSRFSKKTSLNVLTLPEYKTLKYTSASCVICKRLDEISENFISNLFYMYKNDDEFKEKFFSQKGFCMEHFEALVTSSTKYLSGEEAEEFLNRICTLQKENMERLCEEVNWFTKKFDHRYKDEDWKNSKDSVIRGALKDSGYID